MTKDAKDEDARTGRMVSIAVPSERVTRKLFGRHGFASGALVVDWPAIVGPAVATWTMPINIRFPPKERSAGTLVVKVANSAFATEIQHLEPLILERINGHFGWQAVARLKLVHGPLPPRRPIRQPPPEPPPLMAERLERSLSNVDNPELRAALERLGRWVAAKGD